MKLIDENTIYKIKEKIQMNNDECEKQFSTEYIKYKNKINDEYLDIYKNHLILDKISKNIYDMYIKNTCEITWQKFTHITIKLKMFYLF